MLNGLREEILSFYEKHHIKPVVDKVEDATEALAYLWKR
jgi:hypothetical protein